MSSCPEPRSVATDGPAQRAPRIVRQAVRDRTQDVFTSSFPRAIPAPRAEASARASRIRADLKRPFSPASTNGSKIHCCAHSGSHPVVNVRSMITTSSEMYPTQRFEDSKLPSRCPGHRHPMTGGVETFHLHQMILVQFVEEPDRVSRNRRGRSEGAAEDWCDVRDKSTVANALR
jgi:hypothetical protein